MRQLWVADLCAAIKFNNVCRNFSCSLYYVSTKDFEVLDKFFKKYKELGAITLEQKRRVYYLSLVFMWILENAICWQFLHSRMEFLISRAFIY
jgi:hypothetical protein